MSTHQSSLLTATQTERPVFAFGSNVQNNKQWLLQALTGFPPSWYGGVINANTTYSLCWIGYGSRDQCDSFRVHWIDGKTEDFPLDRVSDWSTGGLQGETRMLEFFSNDPFLRATSILNLGLSFQSVRFLSQKRDGEVMAFLPGVPDVLAYEIEHGAPIARADEPIYEEEMSLYRTAFEGNMIAFLDMPLYFCSKFKNNVTDWAGKMCDLLSQHFSSDVHSVHPSSGRLAICAAHQDISVPMWEELAKFATAEDQDVLVSMFFDKENFYEMLPGVALNADTGRQMLELMDLIPLRYAVYLAHTRKIRSGRLLKQTLYEVSGIANAKSAILQRCQRAKFVKSRP